MATRSCQSATSKVRVGEAVGGGRGRRLSRPGSACIGDALVNRTEAQPNVAARMTSNTRKEPFPSPLPTGDEDRRLDQRGEAHVPRGRRVG